MVLKELSFKIFTLEGCGGLERTYLVKERKFTNMEVIQLVKDYTAEGVRGAVEFYLGTNSTWKYHELVEHLRTSFESSETFSLLVGDFYSHIQ